MWIVQYINVFLIFVVIMFKCKIWRNYCILSEKRCSCCYDTLMHYGSSSHNMYFVVITLLSLSPIKHI